jgi:hypothetical protein
MRQPTKDALREQLALAADEIIRLREVQRDAIKTLRGIQDWLVVQSTPLWRRAWNGLRRWWLA